MPESPISSAMAAQGIDLDAMMEGDEVDEVRIDQEALVSLSDASDDQLGGDDSVDEEEAINGLNIPITFGGGGKGGTWDDRELIDAFDAAKEEFELHNPGPGSWLDKATAALAMGKPLPGATMGNSK